MKMFFKLLIVFVFGAYNYYLYTSNQIDNYINQRFFEFSHYASLLALVVSALGIIYLIFKNRKKIIGSIKKTFQNPYLPKFLILIVVIALALVININLLLIALVLVVVFFKKFRFDTSISFMGLIIALSLSLLTSPKSLSSITAYQRESDFNTVSLTATNVNTVQAFSNTANYELGDWIASLNYNPDLTFYKGKDVSVTGFIFSKTDNLFLVSRFVITCCAVDARPVGLPVIFGWKKDFKSDDWVKVSGKFDVQTLDGKEQLVIIAEKVEKTDEPSNPYIY